MARQSRLIVIFLLLFLTLLALASAADVDVSNSRDWVDVYSVMLASGLKGERGFFVNSEAITLLTKVISTEDTIHLYQSNLEPFIPKLDKQLEDVGYNVKLEKTKTNQNFDLDPQTGKYYLVSLGNPRITTSLAPLAIKDNAWVFIVDEENVAAIAERIKDADKVVAVGKFSRNVLDQIEPYLTKHIDNNDIYKDSQEIADEFKESTNIVLTDGKFIEAEFFLTPNPVLLSGSNKILGDTFNYLVNRNAEAVILVGNELSVVGEQIREKSNKEISVFIKFGQGDTDSSGQVYSLSLFPLPQSRLGLTAQQAIYDPAKKELIITFKNIGNLGLYELTNLRIKTDDKEIASTADPEVKFIAAGELLPVIFPIKVDLADVTNETMVEFFTSYGLSPNELDSFLTMENHFGPPFALPLTVQDLGNDSTSLFVEDASYYKSLKRIGVKLSNPSEVDAYATVKVQNIIVNGLEENIAGDGIIPAGSEKVVYIPVQLDPIDLQDNSEFDMIVSYGMSEELKIKTIRVKQPFKIISGGRITGFVSGLGEGSPGSWIALIVIVLLLIVGIILLKHRTKEENQPPKKNIKKVANKKTTTKKKATNKKAAKKKVVKKNKK